MFLKMKKRITNLIDLISEMLGVLDRLSDPVSAISNCLVSLEAIYSQLEHEDPIPKETIKQLQNIKQSFDIFLTDIFLINESSVNELNDQVVLLKTIFHDEIKAKLNVVFFPYKASMWDSLATVYEAASKDENCVAHVVPIPYYQLSRKEEIPTYEGDHFPKNVPITHYSQYSLEEQQPDIIFVHNIYDNNNTLTRVFEQYYTFNLKKYTEMLVYVPYHISSYIPPKKGDISLAYNIPTVENVDKIILVGEFLKETAIRDGIPAEKLLALGSPKLDSMVNAMKEGVSYPPGWKERIEGKTVYLVNTGCMYFVNQPFLALERLLDFLNIPRMVEDSVVIWRPHPLTATSISKYIPYFFEYYFNLTEICLKVGDEIGLYSKIILDDTDDYLASLMAADVLITSESSILNSYLLTEKKVLYWSDSQPKESLLPEDVFYYAFNRSEPWYELVKKFSKGYDPLAENRNGMASKVYKNIDGTAGEKIYQAIKESMLKKLI